MDETSQQSEAIDHRYAQRDIIRQSLNEIANDLSMEMRDAALDFPVYMTVPQQRPLARDDCDAAATHRMKTGRR